VSKVVTLCPAGEVCEGAIRAVELPDGHKIALFRLGDELFALDDTCTHEEASLSEDGCVVDDRVECGWHYGQFDIRTGAACASPCTEPLKRWPLKIVEGRVCVELPDPLSPS
jgi:p-cumate 2,3-dioxygenase ferredoxin subunit